MQAPLIPTIDRAILAEISDIPEAHLKLYDVLKSQDRAAFMDHVFEFNLTSDAVVLKRLFTDQGYYFLATQISIQHDQPTAPPLVDLADGKRQKSVFSSAVNSSAAFGPGAAAILGEGAFITWPFGDEGLIDVSAQRKAGAGTTKISVLVSGWKIQKDF